MPLLGTRDFSSFGQAAPVADDLKGEPLILPDCSFLQAMFEIDDEHLLELLPKPVHPTIPPMASVLFWDCAGGPLGSFRLAQVRVMCRAGFRSRGYLLGAYCDSEDASAVLRRRWGFDCRSGRISLRSFFDATIGTVEAGGRDILSVSLV